MVGCDKKPKTFKSMAKEAKKRMKSGYWQEFDRCLQANIDAANREGCNPSKVTEYYVNRIIDEVNGKRPPVDGFYLKVCNLLNEYGEVSDAIARLIDHSVYDEMTYEQKQRYILELSNKYVEALERYRKEKEFVNVCVK